MKGYRCFVLLGFVCFVFWKKFSFSNFKKKMNAFFSIQFNYLFILFVCLWPCLLASRFDLKMPTASNVPNQVHLALTDSKDEMVVMFTTADKTATSTVNYWLKSAPAKNFSAVGNATTYYFPPNYESPYIHTVKLTGLLPGEIYYYQCGDSVSGWSEIFTFHTESISASTTSNELPQMIFASIADQGTSMNSEQIVNALLLAEEQDKIAFDLLVHSGDISYANGIQKYWDIWGNLVEPFSNHIPWMVAVGNHELLDLFISYQYRFSMPAKQSGATEGNLYYSFNYKLVHFIALNSEAAEYWNHLDAQYTWLKKDLESVNRQITPWIVSMWHSPWYCSNKKHYQSGERMRIGFEELFHQYRVDLAINGHVHAYERTKAVYNNSVSTEGTVYITNGIGGTSEGLQDNWYEAPAWSAYREGTFWGIGIASVFNATHLHWEMRSSSDNEIRDSVWLVRTTEGLQWIS